MLQAIQVQLQRGNRKILNQLDFQLSPGQISVVLGPNGAGKSSLLRVLSGEWTPDSGQIRLDDRPLAAYSARVLGQRRAFLHQDSTLDFAFSVLEVVLLGCSPHMLGSERKSDYATATDALTKVDLLDRQHDLYTRLSGGEQQRVQLARVLAQITHSHTHSAPPRYLFLDEPTNNLDLAHRYAVFRIARQCAAQGIAVCLIIHDINEAIHIADHITVLHNGSIRLSGSPSQIIHDPQLADIFNVDISHLQICRNSLPHLLFAERAQTQSHPPSKRC